MIRIDFKKTIKKQLLKITKIKTKPINKDLHSFYITIICGFFLIGLFSILPFIVNYTSKIIFNAKLIDNNSKVDFEKTLSGKEIKKNKDQESDDLVLRNLFDDVFEFENNKSDVIRLNATLVEQLFKDTGYDLKKVRKNKVVKPVSLSLLPGEIKNIQSTKKKKELFIQIILPLILEENNLIKMDRKKLFVILNKNNNSKKEIKWLNSKFKQYGVVKKDLSTLKIRMDIIPVSLAIAQAAKETGWGTSRFAIEGNALFGQWTWSEEGIKPSAASNETSHKVMKFKILKASVRAYQRNLNTHSSYRDFRKIRAEQRDREEKLNSLELVKYLDKYAATGKKYTDVIKKIIEQNSLTDFDDAHLLPNNKKIKNLI
tara:strand:- start:1264 stop:2379 length:1116 start_codon:yes stop_codon:yes gene_type:complete